MEQQATERRSHQILVTVHSEYLVKGKACVCVLDRHTGIRIKGHDAEDARYTGSLGVSDKGIVPNLDEPRLGDLLCFQKGDSEIITSALVEVRRATWDEFLGLAA